MGKNRKRGAFTKKKNDRNKEKENGREERRTEPYEEIVRENKLYESYYKQQKIVAEENWEEFLNAMKSNLPVTFRVTSSKSQSQVLLEIVREQFFKDYMKAVAEIHQSNEIIEPKCLSWYPNEHAWQLELTRKDIRRSEPLFKLHNFLIAETSSGSISRQEAVSMIPPLVMGVESHHKVLDMCAAPGSKTAQLIEALHGGTDGKLPTGFVVANDIDNKRCYMLVHQAKRLNSPCMVVTNADSSNYPSLKMKNETTGKLIPVKFDRVLCDVPCSGDGTLRKNPDIWNKWNLAQSYNLHGLQCRIVRRGCELLEIGGRLVYSTCSLNPLENEAVLHRLLVEANGAMEIIDAAHMLPTLKYAKGLNYWEPATKDLEFYKKFEDVPEKFQTCIRPSMFPPSAEDAAKYNLDRCIRVYPHHQNTGGFFIALLEKKAQLPWQSQTEKQETMDVDKKIQKSEPPKKKPRYHRGFKEDPFVYFDPNEEIVPSIKTFYQLSDDFVPTNLLTRCTTGKKKNIYFSSSSVKNLVESNEGSIKFINTGVKTLVRNDNKNMDCDFRLAQEGLESIAPFIGAQRRLKVEKGDLIIMLMNTDPTKPPDFECFSQSAQDRIKEISCGSCVLEYEDEKLLLTLVGWKGTRSLRAYIDQNETIHMLRLLGGDLSQFERNKFVDRKAAASEENENENENEDENENENENEVEECETMDQSNEN